MSQAIHTQQQREQVFTGLYQKAFPAVARYVAKMGGSFDEAKDVFQDALVIYYEKVLRNALVLQSSEKAYILGIAKHLWLKTYHAHAGNLTLDINKTDRPQDAETTYASGKLMHYLETAGQKCMEILKAFYYDKLPVAHITRVFDYSGVRSATVQKYKCLEKFAKLSNKSNCIMRTSLNEIKAIEDHLLGYDHPSDHLLFEAKLILNAQLSDNLARQQQVYQTIQQYGRRQLKAEIEAVHQRLAQQPNSFIHKLKRLFSSK